MYEKGDYIDSRKKKLCKNDVEMKSGWKPIVAVVRLPLIT